jgi:hypothetical protein
MGINVTDHIPIPRTTPAPRVGIDLDREASFVTGCQFRLIWISWVGDGALRIAAVEQHSLGARLSPLPKPKLYSSSGV